jgi:TetR/AcrR family transcriptional regulator, transcriptional repressor of bet genes
MSRLPNTETRRAQIVDALASAMAKHGYDGASVADIARRARLAPGLVHYHFKHKLEILIELVRTLEAAHMAALDTALAATDDPGDQLVSFLDVHLGLGAHADARALACWVLATSEALRDKRVRVEIERVLRALTDRARAIIDRGVAGGVFACEDPAAAAAALVALIQGYFTVAASARDLIPSGSAAASALRMATGLLRPRRRLVANRGPHP